MRGFSKILSALLAVVLLMTSLSFVAPSASAEETVRLGYCNSDDVRIRRVYNETKPWFFVDFGWVMEILGEKKYDGTLWYKVECPGTENHNRTYIGYIASSYLTEMTADQVAEWEANPTYPYDSVLPTQPGNPTPSPSPTPDPSVTATPQPVLLGYLKVTASVVNIREQPSTKSTALDIAVKNDVLPIMGTPLKDTDKYIWYKVQSEKGYYGYLRSDCVTLVGDEKPTPDPSIIPTMTATPKVTATPKATATPSSSYGTVTLTRSDVNVRASASMKGQVVGKVQKGQSFEVVSAPVNNSDYTWYHVRFGISTTGYIRGDMVKYDGSAKPTETNNPAALGKVTLTATAVNLRASYSLNSKILKTGLKKGAVYDYLAEPVVNGGTSWYKVNVDGTIGYISGSLCKVIAVTTTVTPVPTLAVTSYIELTGKSVNIRASASTTSSIVAKWLPKGTVMEVNGTTTVSGKLWYSVVYGSDSGWVLGTYAKEITKEQYEDSLKSHPTPTLIPTPSPTSTDPAKQESDYARTTGENVRVRKSASTSSATVTILSAENTVVVINSSSKVGSYTWYNVEVAGVIGYIRGDLLKIMTVAEKEQYLKDQETGGVATYTTLHIGSTGAAVSKLQTALKDLGFYSGKVDGDYGKDTYNAVFKFQESKGFTADGIAGSTTQHELYGTSPEGGIKIGDTTIYAVELVDWYKGDIQKVWPRGSIATITDVKTGLSFRAYRWAGANHADVEPLTAADTKIMCQIYGVSTASKITYVRRSLWVTKDGRSFAASMYGVPHGTQTILDNNFEGQFCVHFVNSKTHGTDRVDEAHQTAIMYAYNNAPSRK